MTRTIIAALALATFAITAAAAAENHLSKLHSFDDFPAALESVETAPLQLRPGTGLANFPTRIEEAYEEGTNFGSHYSVATWGCGIECGEGAIVNRRTGEVTELPASRLHYDYKAGSNLLIVNPLWESLADPGLLGSTPVTYYYRWDGQDFILIDQEDWQYPEPVEAGISADELWKAIAYNQRGERYVALERETAEEATISSLANCDRLYGDCSEGVSALMSETIVFRECSRGPFRFVSVASRGRSIYNWDDHYKVLSLGDGASCRELFKH